MIVSYFGQVVKSRTVNCRQPIYKKAVADGNGFSGGIAFVWHIKDLFVIWIKKTSSLRSLILLMPLLILTMSLADNFFFYLNFQIAYVAFIALAQKELAAKNG